MPPDNYPEGSMTPPIPVLTIPEVAEALRVHQKTVYKLVSARKLRAVKVGRAVRVRLTELERFLSGGR
jgi:excisionase family DNA binding protein